MEISAQNTADHQSSCDSIQAVPGGFCRFCMPFRRSVGYVPDPQCPHCHWPESLPRRSSRRYQFYHDFKTHPVGRIQCRSAALKPVSLWGRASLKPMPNRPWGSTTMRLPPMAHYSRAGLLLGNCACSPSVRINDDIYARVDAERFDDLWLI